MDQTFALREHFCAVQSIGECSAKDLVSLGEAEVACHLEAALDACARADFSASLAPAQEVVQAAWALLQKSGWDHPAWREAYSLAQLCSATAYLSITPPTSTPSADGTTTALPQHQYQSSKPDHTKAVARAAAQRPTTNNCLSMPAVDRPSLQAMQALDLASIMGAPADFLGAVVDAVEPKARQDHQAMYSQPAVKAPPAAKDWQGNGSPATPSQLTDNLRVRQEQPVEQSVAGHAQQSSQCAAGNGQNSALFCQQNASSHQACLTQSSQQLNGGSSALNDTHNQAESSQSSQPHRHCNGHKRISQADDSCDSKGIGEQNLSSHSYGSGINSLNGIEVQTSSSQGAEVHPESFQAQSQSTESQGPKVQQDPSRQNGAATEQHDSNGRTAGLGRLPCAPPQQLPTLQPGKAIARRSVKDLTAAEFKKQYWKTDTPVIITGAMDSWQAMQHWPSLDWWTHHHGHRTVPVELGTDSTDRWQETTMLMHTFMTDYMHPSVCQEPHAEVAYIAQHPLFDQLQALTKDFKQPLLMGGEAVQMNAWIGTQGTVTPLHYDSYDNFLAQVAGFKYLRLYSRRQTPLLYVENGQTGKASTHRTRAQKNVSAVNVEDPDYTRHPKFAEAEHLECVLSPGEMLFIPAKYWHFVRSLSPAISINFWY